MTSHVDPTCISCGGMVARDGWCPRCLTAAPVAAPSPYVPGRTRDLVLAPTGRRTDRSAVTFGPVGRVLWSIAVIVPPALVLWVSQLWAGWGFAAMWWGVVTPWALRDLWRSGRSRRAL